MTSLKCSACQKSDDQLEGRTLSKCSRCLSVAYCSRECQTNDWPSHKAECKRIKVYLSTPRPSPAPPLSQSQRREAVDSFEAFVNSVLNEVVSTMSVASFPELPLYGPKRLPCLFHLHWQYDPSASNTRRKFSLKIVCSTTSTAFLDFVRDAPGMTTPVLSHFKRLCDDYERNEEARANALSAHEREGLPATFRFISTAGDHQGNILNIQMVSGKTPLRTRSGRDPRNANLDLLGALQTVLGQAEELPKGEKDPKLLEKITKAYLKDEGWTERAHEAWTAAAEKTQANGMKENWALSHACRQQGIAEKVLLGGQYASAYVYAVMVPEWPVKCTCGEEHGPEGHLDEEEEEEEEEEDEGRFEEIGGHPGHSEGGHGGHSHSHGGQTCGGHSH